MTLTISRFILLLSSLTLLQHLAQAQEIPVTVQRMDSLLVDQPYRAPATVVPANRAEIRSEVAALIAEVSKDVGDSVKRGETLLRLDDDNARLALQRDRAMLAAIDAQIIEAISRVAKAEELLDKNFISDEELISRRANLAVLQANRVAQEVAIKVAELDFARTHIKAPFDGSVVSRQAQVGSFAQPGTPLITVVQTSDREVDVELDPRYATNIPQVSELRLTSQGKSWKVELLRISSIIDTSSRIVRARFRFSADVAPIGTSGQLEWNELTGLVPVSLIVQRESEFGVFVSENATARFVPIPNAQEGRPAAVALPGETLLVTRGHVRLQDGDSLDTTIE